MNINGPDKSGSDWPGSMSLYGMIRTKWLLKHIEAETNGCHFADDIFKCIFLNENFWIPIKMSLKFVPTGLINNITALVQIMAWRRPGDKPLSEPMMVSSTMHKCVTRLQWVNHNTVYCILRANRACYPGGHYTDYYPGILSLIQITTGAWSWKFNRLQRLKCMTRYQGSFTI